MAKTYSASGVSATGTANKTAVSIVGSTAIRAGIIEYNFGDGGQTPADQSCVALIARHTTVGTGSAFTPLPLDPADIAAVCTANITHSAEPTYTAGGMLMRIPLNQRATYRWVCYMPGRELYGAAAANNGIALYLLSATASLILDATLHWQE